MARTRWKNQLQHEGCTGRSINDEIPQYYQGRYVKRRRTSCSALGSRLFTRLRECQNPITWDPNGGLPFTDSERAEIFAELDKDYISGITFSGGDPLHPSNIAEVTALAREIREKYPDKTIWLYTGSLWEEIQQYEIIHYLDVCVDGEFQVDKKEVLLKWKGSSNQRVIDVQASLRENRVVLYAE